MSSHKKTGTPITPRPTKAMLLRNSAIASGTTGSSTSQRQDSEPDPPSRTPRSVPTADEPPTTQSRSSNRGPSLSSSRNSQASDGVRSFMAQQRASAAKSKVQPNSDATGEDGSGLSLERLLKQARTSGRLNISNRNLSLIPNSVWDMHHTNVKSINFDFNSSSSGDAWYETIDLTRFVAADNAIEEISARIGEEFPGLTVVDLHNNKLSNLPREFGQLEQITQLNLSYNRLTTIPSAIFQLKLMSELQLVGNQIEFLDPKIGRLNRIEHLDLSQNHLTNLPDEIGDLSNLRKLKVSKNRLTTLPPAHVLVKLTKLAEFEAAENQLTVLFGGFDESSDTFTFPTLHYLDLRQNNLVRIDDAPWDGTTTGDGGSLFRPPVFLPKLKELLLSHNRLASLGTVLHTCPDLVILDVQGNKFTEIPDGVLTLKNLNRLDIAGNLLQYLPAELGLLEGLSVLTWEGNQIKNAPKVGRSTAELLKSLRDRLAADEDINVQEAAEIFGGLGMGKNPKVPITEAMTASTSARGVSAAASKSTLPAQSQQAISTRTLELTRKNIATLSEEDLEGVPFDPVSVALEFNNLIEFPISLRTFIASLTHITLHHNKITALPTSLTDNVVFPNLQTLDLSQNVITAIEPGSGSTSFPALHTLNMSHNRLSSLPTDLTSALFPALTSLIVSSNKITEIKAASFVNLHVLDLSNNDIGHLPPDLGGISSIQMLVVDGNSFRVPRRAVLEGGTKAVMQYLKSRMVV